MVERTTDLEVIGIVDGRFGPEGLAFLVVLLDLGLLVLHVERGHDPLRQDAGAEAAWGPAGDAAVEEELHLIGPPEVEILADHLFEEPAARERTVEDLGEGELALQDRQVIPIAACAV